MWITLPMKHLKWYYLNYEKLNGHSDIFKCIRKCSWKHLLSRALDQSEASNSFVGASNLKTQNLTESMQLCRSFTKRKKISQQIIVFQIFQILSLLNVRIRWQLINLCLIEFGVLMKSGWNRLKKLEPRKFNVHFNSKQSWKIYLFNPTRLRCHLPPKIPSFSLVSWVLSPSVQLF